MRRSSSAGAATCRRWPRGVAGRRAPAWPGAMRLTSPASTVPAPTSIASRRRPSPTRRWTDSSQRTGRRHLPRRAARARAPGSCIGRRLDVGDDGDRGRGELDAARARPASRSAAGCMSAQWNGALTASGMARLAPRALAAAHGALDGGLVAGDHDLAAAVEVRRRRTTSPHSAPPRRRRPPPSAASSPRMAAIAPTPGGHRLLHELAAQVHEPDGVREAQSAPAATSAEYSPSECPATAPAAGRSRARSTRSAATLVARIAGCAFAVSVSSSSGPSKQSLREREARAPRRPRRRRRAPRGTRRRARAPMPDLLRALAGEQEARCRRHALTTAPPPRPRPGRRRAP